MPGRDLPAFLDECPEGKRVDLGGCLRGVRDLKRKRLAVELEPFGERLRIAELTDEMDRPVARLLLASGGTGGGTAQKTDPSGVARRGHFMRGRLVELRGFEPLTF